MRGAHGGARSRVAVVTAATAAAHDDQSYAKHLERSQLHWRLLLGDRVGNRRRLRFRQKRGFAVVKSSGFDARRCGRTRLSDSPFKQLARAARKPNEQAADERSSMADLFGRGARSENVNGNRQ